MAASSISNGSTFSPNSDDVIDIRTEFFYLIDFGFDYAFEHVCE